MKKIISFLILIIFIGMLLCGCNPKNPKEEKYLYNFVVIKKEGSFGDYWKLMYDKNTKIVYMYLQDGYRAGLSPYYIIVNGEPTIAIYGVNYEYQE